MKKVNWDEVLIRCSCIGKIMTEGKGTVLTEKQAEYLESLQSKEKITDKQSITLAELIAKRDAPPTLSDTCTSYLREVYQYHRYGKESVGGAQRSVAVKKGNLCEEESIMLLSRFFGANFTKNTERKNGSHTTGEADIVWHDTKQSLDTKSVWDMESLLSHVPNPEKKDVLLYDRDYEWQGMGYMDLWNLDSHILCYTLVNMPVEIIESEKWKIYKAMNPATELEPDYLKAIEKLENNCTFDEIPIHERVITFTFERDDEMIRKFKAKIEDCRIWLEKFEKSHLSLHK